MALELDLHAEEQRVELFCPEYVKAGNMFFRTTPWKPLHPELGIACASAEPSLLEDMMAAIVGDNEE